MTLPGHRAATCPKPGLHTKAPEGYLAWHEWAERKSATHVQQRCPACGRWEIWKKRVLA